MALLRLFAVIMWSVVPLIAQTDDVADTADIVDPASWRVEGALTFSHFQQQVKQKIGGETGEKLVNEFQIGLGLSGTYRIMDFLAAGLHLRLDRGERSAARFEGFDGNGATQVTGQTGGTYSELWFGPLVQFSWKGLMAEVGYGAIGIRNDDARDDLPSSSGSTEDAFTTSPAVAWLLGLGGNIPVCENLDAVIKVEYRVRYYTQRGREDILDGVEHGTQSIAPLVGVAWHF